MASERGDLHLGHILGVAGLSEADVLNVRHTYTSADGLVRGATPAQVRDYTRRQHLKPGSFPANPPRLWLIFTADGGLRSRFLTAYDNRGRLEEERDEMFRFYDLHESEALSALRNRLVVEWPAPINWTRAGSRSHDLPVVEIADPQVEPFPGYDRVLITYSDLKALVEEVPRWTRWRAALAAVQGVYLIADTSTGRLYVGKADGRDRILGRWATYATDGHGGNVAMKALDSLDPAHRQHFMFSILRVFGPEATATEVAQAETHYKRALMTKQYGLNRN